MRLAVRASGLLFLAAFAAAAAACSLNPQPLPPNDGVDADAGYLADASLGDAGAGGDSSPHPQDAGEDATRDGAIGLDASSDVSAPDGAPGDGSVDDGSLDAVNE